MSWQQYVDTQLINTDTKVADAAGIYDLQGNPWAYSAGFAAQVAEVQKVAQAIVNGTATDLAGTGAYVAGVKYVFVKYDPSEEILYVKKGNTGVAFAKCNTCIIVAFHSDKTPMGSCMNAVGKLAEFLKNHGS